MPAPTAPEETSTTSRPAWRCSAICATNCSIWARSGCFRLSVRTPVPSLTTMRVTSLRIAERTEGYVAEPGAGVEFQIPGARGRGRFECDWL